MEPRKKIDVARAQNLAKQLLDTKLTDILDAQTVQAMLENGRTEIKEAELKTLVNQNFDRDGLDIQFTALDPQNATLRDFLGFTGNQAGMDLPVSTIEGFRSLLNQSEDILKPIIHEANSTSSIKGAHKFAKFAVALDDLANEGTVPNANALQKGLGVLQALVRKNKAIAADVSAQSRSAEGLESEDLLIRTQFIIAAIQSGDSTEKFITDDMRNQVLAAFGTITNPTRPRDPAVKKAREEVRTTLKALLHEHEADVMDASQYKAGAESSAAEAKTKQGAADAYMHIINATHEVAEALGMDLNEKPKGRGGRSGA